MQALVSRSERRVYSYPYGLTSKYADEVALWTDAGNFTMPYEAFRRLFGIDVPRWAERVVVDLPTKRE